MMHSPPQQQNASIRPAGMPVAPTAAAAQELGDGNRAPTPALRRVSPPSSAASFQPRPGPHPLAQVFAAEVFADPAFSFTYYFS